MSENPQTPPPESRRGTPHLTRDQRRDILLLSSLDFTEERIAEQLLRQYNQQISLRQITYTIRSEKATPQKYSGRPAKLSEAQIDTLEAFVQSSKFVRRIFYKALTKHFSWENVGPDSIKHFLHKRG